MSSLVLIDASVWIPAIRGADSSVELIDQLLSTRRAATNHVIVTELLIGARTAQEYQEFEDDLAVLPHLSLTEDVWREGRRLGFGLRRKGVTVPLPDVIIAACAMVHDCELLCSDRDFDLIARHAPLKLYKHARLRAD